jgi:hypothetical protein
MTSTFLARDRGAVLRLIELHGGSICLPVEACWPVIGTIRPIFDLMSCAAAGWRQRRSR